MDFSKTNPIKLTGIRIEQRPDGGIALIISTKYAGETVYALPAELVQDLISDLERVRPSAPSRPSSAAASEASAKPAAQPSKPSTPTTQIGVRAPKKWMLGNGLPNHPMVVFIVDPQTDQQAGYAFDAKAARELAVALVKNADAIAAHANKQGSGAA